MNDHARPAADLVIEHASDPLTCAPGPADFEGRILDINRYEDLPYRLGCSAIETVTKRGKVVAYA